MKCLGHHVNEFKHFDSGIPEMAAYDLGIKIRDDEAPPPLDSRSEPRLYLYVSAKELKSQRDLGTIQDVRSRTYLQDRFPSSQADRERLQGDVIGRLHDDVNALANGNLKSSEEDPIFIRPNI
jgi:hypothetical protein